MNQSIRTLRSQRPFAGARGTFEAVQGQQELRSFSKALKTHIGSVRDVHVLSLSDQSAKKRTVGWSRALRTIVAVCFR